MLPKKNRLPSYLIPQVVKKGKRFDFALFTLFVDSRKPSEKVNNKPTRFAFVVSLKMDKRAVKRNRLKRQLREIIRKDLDKIRSNYNVIFLGKKKLMAKSFTSIEVEINKALKKAKLLTK